MQTEQRAEVWVLRTLRGAHAVLELAGEGPEDGVRAARAELGEGVEAYVVEADDKSRDALVDEVLRRHPAVQRVFLSRWSWTSRG